MNRATPPPARWRDSKSDEGEGLRLIARDAFPEMGLHRLEANIQPANLASIAVAKNCGFHKEGFSRLPPGRASGAITSAGHCLPMRPADQAVSASLRG